MYEKKRSPYKKKLSYVWLPVSVWSFIQSLSADKRGSIYNHELWTFLGMEHFGDSTLQLAIQEARGNFPTKILKIQYLLPEWIYIYDRFTS